MKIAPITLDDRDREDRREMIENKIAGGHWHACVASIDIRYWAPIIIDAKGRYEISRPIEFRRLGIKGKMKKFFSDIVGDGKKMILEAAAIRGESPPLLSIFGPLEKKRPAWKRTRNTFKCQHAESAEVRRFRPIEIGWRASVERVISLDLTPGAKVLLIYAYGRGFETGEFYASSETASKDTKLHAVHIRNLFPILVELKQFEPVKQEAKGVWRYAFLAPIDELPCCNLKLQESAMKSASCNLKLPATVTLSANSGNLSLHKSDKGNKKDTSRSSTRDKRREREKTRPQTRLLGLIWKKNYSITWPESWDRAKWSKTAGCGGCASGLIAWPSRARLKNTTAYRRANATKSKSARPGLPIGISATEGGLSQKPSSCLGQGSRKAIQNDCASELNSARSERECLSLPRSHANSRVLPQIVGRSRVGSTLVDF